MEHHHYCDTGGEEVNNYKLVSLLLNRLVSYMSPLLLQGVMPVIVMDGKVPKEKLPVCTRRYKEQVKRASKLICKETGQYKPMDVQSGQKTIPVQRLHEIKLYIEELSSGVLDRHLRSSPSKGTTEPDAAAAADA